MIKCIDIWWILPYFHLHNVCLILCICQCNFWIILCLTCSSYTASAAGHIVSQLHDFPCSLGISNRGMTFNFGSPRFRMWHVYCYVPSGRSGSTRLILSLLYLYIPMVWFQQNFSWLAISYVCYGPISDLAHFKTGSQF